jgi:predicted amidohydrolase YtcJ
MYQSRITRFFRPTLFGLLLATPVATHGETADVALVNGHIYRVDAERSWANAVAIKDGHFIAVGTDADVDAFIGPQTRLIDLGGKMAMPGIHDMHMHPVEGSLTKLYECAFPATASLEEIATKVRSCAGNAPPGSWIRGGAYGAQLLEAERKPHKSLLDAAAPEHPVFLRSSGGHSGWANSRALVAAGIDTDTPDPVNGEIRRDAVTGEPTGILLERANGLVARAIPDYTPMQYREAVTWLARYLNGYGITAINDAAVGDAEIQAYSAADRAGELPLRVATSLLWRTEAPTQQELARPIKERFRHRTEHVYTDFVKIFVDGSAGARKAAYLEPYQPDEAHGDAYYGEFMVPPDKLAEYLILLDGKGLQVKMHCGGDAAVRAALDAIEAAREANGDSGLRHEIAHANLVHPEDIPRFKELNAVADLSPMYWYPSRIIQVLTKTLGPDRVQRVWSIKTLVAAGASPVYGSDWPAVVPNASPFRGLEAMVTRRDPDGKQPGQFRPEEAVDLATALDILTINGAYAMRLASETGSIEVGKLADMIVLDRNLFEIPPSEISDTRVLLTFLDGRIVYDAQR